MQNDRLRTLLLGQTRMSVINSKRIRDYPRIFFITIWTILLLSVLFRHGWLNAFNQIIGSDFVTLYAAGYVHRTDLPNLYNFANQAETQQALIQPTRLPGLNPFISPPYVAAAYSLFTYLPLPLALTLWTVLSLLITFFCVGLLIHILPELLKKNLVYWQLLIIILSFFPFIEGFQAGQNHTLSLLLVTCCLLFTLSEKWFLAGSMAGLMIYKPQLVLGFLIIWIIWRKFKALAAFGLITTFCLGAYILVFGITPLQDYLNISKDLVLLPYIPGFPGYLLLTIYGLFTSLFHIENLPVIRLITLLLSLIIGIGLCWLAYKLRNLPILSRSPALFLAILLPLVATPYVLLHDMVILIPGFIIWARYRVSRGLLYTVIVIYLGGLFLTLMASVTKVAVVSLLPIGLIAFVFQYISSNRKEGSGSTIL